MESQKLETKVLDSQSLEQLQNDIQKEINELLNNSNIGKILADYGVSGQNILKIQCSLDLNKLQGKDTDIAHQAANFAPETLQAQQTFTAFSTLVFCDPCPDPRWPLGCLVRINS